MSTTSLITMLALIASVTAEPFIYGAPLLSPPQPSAYTATARAAAYNVATAYNRPPVAAGYGVLPTIQAPLPAYDPYVGAYTLAAPAAYSGVEEFAPVVNAAAAPYYGLPYAYTAGYLYGR